MRLNPRSPDLPSAPCGGCVCNALGACRRRALRSASVCGCGTSRAVASGSGSGIHPGKPFAGMPERQFGRLNGRLNDCLSGRSTGV